MHFPLLVWEQRKLKDVAKIIGGGTPSTKIKEYWNGNINWYSPIEIGNQTFVSSSRKKISELGLKKSSAKLLPGGNTILFTSRAGIGDMAIMKTAGSTNQGFQSWVVRSNLADVYFLYSLGKKLKKQALRKASGSTFLEISNSEVKKLLLFLPSLREQKEIGKIFKLIDKLLSLQQRKLRYLSAIKKSLLQNMLVDNDLRPELRFTKFSGNWEQHKISEMAKRLDNLRIPVTASNRKKGDIPYYGANGIQDYVEGFTHKGENILIAEDGANNLDNYPIRLVKGKIWVNNHAHVLKAYKNCTDIQFLEFELKKLNIYKYLVGGSRLKLNADILMNISIKSPTLKEQKKIGFMLSLLEENTIFQQRKLNKLELLNQFFLQHMFI
ncbi:MAG: restriction endonuclease subunit S [Bacillales bacterium]|nr:restriction endonuclease subunit S [Bacillales bacterium]